MADQEKQPPIQQNVSICEETCAPIKTAHNPLFASICSIISQRRTEPLSCHIQRPETLWSVFIIYYIYILYYIFNWEPAKHKIAKTNAAKVPTNLSGSKHVKPSVDVGNLRVHSATRHPAIQNCRNTGTKYNKPAFIVHTCTFAPKSNAACCYPSCFIQTYPDRLHPFTLTIFWDEFAVPPLYTGTNRYNILQPQCPAVLHDANQFHEGSKWHRSILIALRSLTQTTATGWV